MLSRRAANSWRCHAQGYFSRVGAYAGLMLLVFGPALTGCGDTKWYLDPGFAERKAAKDQRPMLYYFKAFDSTLHRNMYWQVLQNGSVKKELRDTINIELEFGFFDDRQSRYKVDKPQTCVLATPNGAQVGDSLSVNPVPDFKTFLNWLRAVKSQLPPTKPSTETVEDPPATTQPEK